MALYPVIMCGGAGARLWPTSTLGHPKPFLDLLDDHSLFAATVERMAPLAGPDAELIIVAGEAHRRVILAELEALDRSARLILEPEARDSGPAVAAAAVAALRLSPDSVIAVVASDHHIPDAEGFRSAVLTAHKAALDGRIVALGVRPTWPSPGFGYIDGIPCEQDVCVVRQFVEKPDAKTAADYIARGYLWNSGNLIARADVVVQELRRYAPDILTAAEAALDSAALAPGTVRLGSPFRSAPKRSIDYAVMEKTALASVLPVDFTWSDIGNWDAVIESQGRDRGAVLRIDAPGGLARAAPGMELAIVGAPDLIVIAEEKRVLVARQKTSGLVRDVADHFGPTPQPEEALSDLACRYIDWMRLRALPLWSTLGVSPVGRFHEALDPAGRPVDINRRARVQPRQSYSFCLAAGLGWSGHGREIAERAMDLFEKDHALSGGGYQTLLAPDGTSVDDTALSYDLAFVLLAKSSLARSTDAAELLPFLDNRAHIDGGYREADHRPFQSNANMHLFEAFLAWDAVEPDSHWAKRADALAVLAMERLMDPQGGFIREVYQSDWRPALGAEGEVVEPGHQFEWAYLLQTWASRRGDGRGKAAARRLFEAGCRGVDQLSDYAIDEMDASLRPTRRSARLWPQAERLKASLALVTPEMLPSDLQQARSALARLLDYLKPDGLWGDVMADQGRMTPGPAPASSLYHLITALEQLALVSCSLPGFDSPLDLS